MRVVNVHQAKTHLSRLIDEAHAGETIVLAKAGKPWARLMPLEPPAPQRIPGRLRSRGPLSQRAGSPAPCCRRRPRPER
jgi:prevent-host-death family protein